MTRTRYISAESLHRPEVVRWRSRVRERYLPPDAELAVLLPCSAAKPYSTSKSHRRFIGAIRRGGGCRCRVHEVVMTSPLGIVPRELEGLYPACCYDVPVTGHWSGEEIEVLEEMLAWYLEVFPGEVVCYAQDAYAEVAERLGVEVVARENLLGRESLRRLERRVAEVAGECRCTGTEDAAGVLDFQFGRGAREMLEGARVEGARVYRGNTLLGRLGAHGVELSLAGAERLAEVKPEYVVELNFFPGSGNVLAPGVRRAGAEVLPGDEVAAVFEGRVVGAGRAVLGGREMEEAERGVCVVLREVRARE